MAHTLVVMGVRVVVVSDTHGQHKQVEVPPGDLLVHCGDWTRSSSSPSIAEYRGFAAWLAAQPHAAKVVVAGNKEVYMDTATCTRHRQRPLAEVLKVQALLLEAEGVTYLQDSGYQFAKDGQLLAVWASPWTARNGGPGKAFQLEAGELAERWEQVPEGVDILVTHSPAQGRLDRTEQGVAAGCPGLRELVDRARPLLHLCGHIHEGRGVLRHGATTTANAAVMDQRNRVVGEAVVFDISSDRTVTQII